MNDPNTHSKLRLLKALIFGPLLMTAAVTHAGDPKVGQQRANSCVMCHGAQGLSNNPGAPHLAGQPMIYIAEQLRHYREGSRKNPVMNVIAKPLSDQDIQDLAAWYSSIEIQLKP